MGCWQLESKKEITKKYVSFIQESKQYIEIDFIKVPAHSGVALNEEVDSLAKNSLLAKGYKTYNDGSVYFVGFGVSDWKAIAQIINEENMDLSGESIQQITFSEEAINSRVRVVITHMGNRVVINCYSNTRSYVQGKQTVLFQKVIATAVEMLKNGHSVIETLNNYHALNITQECTENYFEQLLPCYNNSRDTKHYFNLLSAVYNTMLTGYMPDYTCLVTPIFRGYEYYLHKILGEKMGLETATEKGINKFSYFSKDSTGRYTCNCNTKESLLNNEQLEFLNDLYNNYNNVRHPYSHWSADDYDTAVITDISIARELLLKGIKLVNEYYKLF